MFQNLIYILCKTPILNDHISVLMFYFMIFYDIECLSCAFSPFYIIYCDRFWNFSFSLMDFKFSNRKRFKKMSYLYEFLYFVQKVHSY